MKKLLAAALCILIMLCATTDCQAAQAEVGLSLDSSELYVGGIVTLTVSFTAQHNMNAYFYRLKYDSSKVSFVSTSAENYNAVQGEIVYIYTGNTPSVSETFTFSLIGEGDTYFTLADITYADNEEYYLGDESLSLSVRYIEVGDVDGNGTVQTADMAALKLYLAGVDSLDIVFAGADMDKNLVVNVTDLAKLKLYLAGIR